MVGQIVFGGWGNIAKLGTLNAPPLERDRSADHPQSKN